MTIENVLNLLNNHENWMIDIETTSLNQSTGYISSVAMVHFIPDAIRNMDKIAALHSRISDNEERLELCHRYNDITTMEWRAQHKIEESEAVLPYMDVKELWAYMNHLLTQSDKPALLWAKPTTFDLAFLESYFNDFSWKTPWHYRSPRDLNSFFTGLGLEKSIVESHVKKDFAIDESKLHDAAYDCNFQIVCLQTALQLA